MSAPTPALSDAEIFALDRPSPKLFVYYFLFSLITLVAFPIVLAVHYFRYHTLRYRFDDEGVSMSWGILFRREIHLTYSRIQDIHLVSNFAERWLGLARINIQTASGSAKAEMTIEGVEAFESLRDFLYARMRGARDGTSTTAAPGARTSALPEPVAAELTATLREVADELRALRRELHERSAGDRADA
jgi:putative membrane protein